MIEAANFRVLYELARRAPDFRPKRVLDYGAGPAPALAAVQEIWPNCMEYCTAIEPSEPFPCTEQIAWNKTLPHGPEPTAT